MILTDSVTVDSNWSFVTVRDVNWLSVTVYDPNWFSVLGYTWLLAFLSLSLLSRCVRGVPHLAALITAVLGSQKPDCRPAPPSARPPPAAHHSLFPPSFSFLLSRLVVLSLDGFRLPLSVQIKGGTRPETPFARLICAGLDVCFRVFPCVPCSVASPWLLLGYVL